MNKKVLGIIFGFGIFGAGVIFGKQIQKKNHRKTTAYGGSIQIHTVDGLPEAYLALRIPTEDLVNLTDVIFEVIKK